jgi:hypothetical protein
MSAIVYWSDVERAATELKGFVDIAFQTVILAVVNGPGVSTSVFADPALLKAARILLACHMATLHATQKGVAGPITSQSEGGVSQSYATTMIANPRVLDTTNYGRLFRQLAMGTSARAGLVV